MDLRAGQANPASAGSVIVTGGASGIGLATVQELLLRARKVVVADAGGDAILKLRRQLESDEDRVLYERCDVSDETEVSRMFHAAEERFGRIQGLVQSAGIGVECPFVDTSVSVFRKVVDVNLLGSFIVGRAAARHMLRNGGGAIVNIASASGVLGNAGRAAYGASKAGVIAMTKVMAVELAESGIRVNAVAPGAIETPLVKDMHSPQTRASLLDRIPQRRYGTPLDVATIIATLLDDALCGYCTGQVLAIDGGMTAAGLMAIRSAD